MPELVPPVQVYSRSILYPVKKSRGAPQSRRPSPVLVSEPPERGVAAAKRGRSAAVRARATCCEARALRGLSQLGQRSCHVLRGADAPRPSQLGQRSGDVLLEAFDLCPVVEGVELGDDVEGRDDVVVGMVLGVGEDGVGDALAVVDREVPA